MKIAYYPGCSLHSAGIEYDISTKKVCAAMGIELQEVKDWICCGSSPAHHSDELMSVALPAKVLALTAQTNNSKEVCVPCASCYSRLKDTQSKMADENLKKNVEGIIGSKYPEDIQVWNILDFFVEKVGIDAIKEKVTRNLNSLKVVSYYGCLMTRPPKVTGKQNFENPTEMESVMEALGAEAIDWNMKTFCCGAGFALTYTDMVLDLMNKILIDACSVGAQVISTACPLCHFNLDSRQTQINEKFDTNFNIPIFYFTELMGLAMGIEAKELGIFKHLTDVKYFLKERGLI